MAKNFVSLLHVCGLSLLISVTGAAGAMAGQNGFGDVMAATSYFPTRNLAAFGTDEGEALVASADAAPDSAAALSAITPAAGDVTVNATGKAMVNAAAGATVHAEPYGPFQPGKEPAIH